MKEASLSTIALDSRVPTESRYLATGTLAPAPGGNQAVYSARVREWDARKAEALSFGADVHPLERVRTLLARGKLDESGALLRGLETAGRRSAERGELALEHGRLAAFRGDWPEAARAAGLALGEELAPVSRMSAHQVRAAALFELGEFSEAWADLELVRSFAALFPFSPCGVYAEVYRARLRARRESVAGARADLRAIGARLRERGGDLDAVLAWLKGEIDVRRLEGRPTWRRAVATLWLAERIGDDLYAALARLDVGCAQRAPDRALTEADRGFERVRRLLDEVAGRAAPGSTARAIADGLRGAAEPAPAGVDGLRPRRHLVFTDAGSLFDVERGKLLALPPSRQFSRLLAALARGPTARSDCFAAVWPGQRYVARLHDGPLKSLLHRLRAATGLRIRNTAGSVELEDALCIPEEE